MAAFGLAERVASVDARVTRWMARHGPALLRVALGVVFLWFGALKFVPGLSPADELATKTIATLTFGVVQAEVSRPVLAAWESLIGLGLIGSLFLRGPAGGWVLRGTLLLMVMQMLGTVTPLVLFPDETWRKFPIALTLEGQYIVKNIVLVAAGVVIGAGARGGAMIAHPGVARRAVVDEDRRTAGVERA